MKRLIHCLCLLLALSLGTAASAASIQCANLVYGGSKTSRCFSDEFLSDVQKKTTIATERPFKSVKLASEELFQFPFVIMTGESDFTFTPQERENMKRYLYNGGFLLASAGCSSKSFDAAFRREIKTIFPDYSMDKLPMTHTLFHTVYDIDKLKLHSSRGSPAVIEGLEHNGKIVLIYSHHGLNNTANSQGCCCCGGNEIDNAIQVNVNTLVYSLMY